jgi:guanylate cyclase
MAVVDSLESARPAVAMLELSSVAISLGALIALRLKPRWVKGIFGVVFFSFIAEVLVETIVLGGLVTSSATILFGLLAVLGALIAFSVRAAFWWMIAYLVTIVLALIVPNWIEPVYVVEVSASEVASVLIGATVIVFATMAYFVRQRDRFQQQSDDLLHNILPDEIAQRLKDDTTMIADSFESASVLFADVVEFTPMSAAMSAPELVGLLNNVFTAFDRLVAELGLEKIKTVGDEYMVAAGVPVARPDHAYVIAELALRIRDHVESNQFDGHRIQLRIGINSGPVVAGIIGTHKFSFDLWGDTVNTASRMESEGLPGAIQVSTTTYELIHDGFVCEPRGVVSIKGKGEMETYLLTERRTSVRQD